MGRPTSAHGQKFEPKVGTKKCVEFTIKLAIPLLWLGVSAAPAQAVTRGREQRGGCLPGCLAAQAAVKPHGVVVLAVAVAQAVDRGQCQQPVRTVRSSHAQGSYFYGAL